MKDALGNELKPGQLVELQLQTPRVFARVAQVREGGVITGMRNGKTEVKPARLVLVANHILDIEPTLNVAGSVISLLDPDPINADAIERLMDTTRANLKMDS